MRFNYNSKTFRRAFAITVFLLVSKILYANLEQNSSNPTTIAFWNNRTYKVKTTKGSTLIIKKENVFCDYKKVVATGRSDDGIYPTTISFGLNALDPDEKPKPKKFVIVAECRANGVLTDLTGYKTIYSSDPKTCRTKSSNIPCLAGEFYNKYSKDKLEE